MLCKSGGRTKVSGDLSAATKNLSPSLGAVCKRTVVNTDFTVRFNDVTKKSCPGLRFPNELITSAPPGRSTRWMLENASCVSKCEGEESPRNASRITASYFFSHRLRK